MTKAFLAKLGIAIDKDEVTDEEGQALIEKSFKDKDEEKSKLKGQVDKYSTEIASYKKEKEAKMTDDEKTKARIEELEKQLNDSKRTNIVNEKVANLVELGYDKETAIKYANDEVDGKSTIGYQKAFKEKIEANIRAEILKSQKDPNIGNGKNETKFTKENFKKGLISMEEMNELKEKDPTLYKSLVK